MLPLKSTKPHHLPPANLQVSSAPDDNQHSSTSVTRVDGASKPLSKASAFGDSTLQNYASHIDPFQANGDTHAIDSEFVDGITASSDSSSVVASTVGFPLTTTTSAPPLGRPTSFLRSNVVPQQTILKAMASRPPGSVSYGAPVAATLAGLKNHQSENEKEPISVMQSSHHLSAALSGLQMNAFPGRSSSVGGAPFHSPFFFHRRLEAVVNIDKVLEEIAEESEFSHARLMKTATGVREASKQLQRRPIKRAVRNVMVVTGLST